MKRKELMRTRCWACWWQEGSRCYRKDLATVIKVDAITLQGEEITQGLIDRCGPLEGFDSKRMVLERVIPKDMLVIVSEKNKKREMDDGHNPSLPYPWDSDHPK